MTCGLGWVTTEEPACCSKGLSMLCTTCLAICLSQLQSCKRFQVETQALYIELCIHRS